MNNVYKVLEQKKAQLAQLQREIDALELVIPMLDEPASVAEPPEYGPTAPLPPDEVGRRTKPANGEAGKRWP